MADFRIQDEGTIVLLYPQSEEALSWFAEHVEAFIMYGAYVVERRFVMDILQGLAEAGLTHD
jgi:hypothetical protein